MAIQRLKVLGLRSDETDPDGWDKPVAEAAAAVALAEAMEDDKAQGGEAVRVVDSPDLRRAILDAHNKIEQWETQRAALNANISAEIEALDAWGINREAFRYARKVMGMKETKKLALDQSYAICRGALGYPVQGDLLT